jgi:hypothetical protein
MVAVFVIGFVLIATAMHLVTAWLWHSTEWDYRRAYERRRAMERWPDDAWEYEVRREYRGRHAP